MVLGCKYPICNYSYFYISIHSSFFSDTSNTFSIINFTYQHTTPTNEIFVWGILSCLAPIGLLSIWFFTSNAIWRYYILFPMSFFIYGFFIRLISIDSLTRLSEIIVFKFLLTILFLGVLIVIDKIRQTKRLNRNYLFLNLKPNDYLYGNSKRLYFKLNEWILSMEKRGEGMSIEEYLKRLYQTQRALDEESGLIVLKQEDAKKNRKIFEVTSIILLASIPFLYILTRLIPNGPQSYSLGWFYVHDHGFEDLSSFVWYITLKIFLLIPLLIWFISSRTWWRYAILVPIILYTYQLWETLKNESKTIDQFELFKAAPAILFILGLILFLSNRIKYQYKIYDVYLDIIKDINILLEEISDQKSRLADKRKEFDLIKADNSPESLEKNRASLIKIREALIAELNYKKAE
jgi:hypothetical protein